MADARLATTLSEDEREYHVSVMAQKRAADAVAQSWSAHLVQKYGLATGDSITDDGRIVRASPPRLLGTGMTGDETPARLSA